MKRAGAAQLGHDSVHLWYAFCDESETAEVDERLLSADERRRHDRLLLPAARHRFAVAHALVRRVLSSYVDLEPQEWRFHAGPHGKPEIAAPSGLQPLRFNLSHTEGLCACAVTLEREIGVDVEMTGRRTERIAIARRFFSPEEVAAIEARPESFFDYWTLKEAYIKACGRGLSMPLREFSLRLDGAGKASLSTGRCDWRFFRDAPSARHLCAVAVRATDESDLRLTILR